MRDSVLDPLVKVEVVKVFDVTVSDTKGRAVDWNVMTSSSPWQ